MPAPRIAIALTLLAGGCVTTGLPAPEPGLDRTRVQRRVTTCRGESCTFDFRVAGTRYRVRSAARTVSPEEATGGAKPSVARRVLGTVGGNLLRAIGLTTSSRVVELDTRTVADSASSLEMRCSLVTIMEIEAERVGDADEEATIELARGADCAVTATGDSIPRWRYRAGITPVADSIAAALAALGHGTSPLPTGETHLERLVSPDEVVRYTVADTSPGFWTPETRTVVRRADGGMVGIIVRLAGDPVAIDIAPGAEGAEAGVLRLLGVVFVRR